MKYLIENTSAVQAQTCAVHGLARFLQRLADNTLINNARAGAKSKYNISKFIYPRNIVFAMGRFFYRIQSFIYHFKIQKSHEQVFMEGMVENQPPDYR